MLLSRFGNYYFATNWPLDCFHSLLPLPSTNVFCCHRCISLVARACASKQLLSSIFDPEAVFPLFARSQPGSGSGALSTSSAIGRELAAGWAEGPSTDAAAEETTQVADVKGAISAEKVPEEAAVDTPLIHKFKNTHTFPFSQLISHSFFLFYTSRHKQSQHRIILSSCIRLSYSHFLGHISSCDLGTFHYNHTGCSHKTMVASSAKILHLHIFLLFPHPISRMYLMFSIPP